MEGEVVLSKLTEQIRAELGRWVFPTCIPLLLSVGYAASVQLSSSGWVTSMALLGGDGASEEDAGLWKSYFVVESLPIPGWQFRWHICGRVSHFGRACLFFLTVSQLEVVFFMSLEILEWRGAFLQIRIGQDSSFLIFRFSCAVSLYWCIFKMHQKKQLSSHPRAFALVCFTFECCYVVLFWFYTVHHQIKFKILF